ncbi:hypothetical protein GJ744_002497 [Endocarpon pusillum]|uniref:HMG box domain-containing protein n=1 Tax=Endocarpon pusillum TaxID=364733 RepID=A0A8H7A8W0_9EURO|nr:hypothetical protein GJ744_002497 [Endocarpon pusillum]
MTELEAILTRLGLEQYLDSFIVEGFDTWETVLDIQEGDLDALNVKLGHRRKLQREIANHRGVLYERAHGSPTTETSIEAGKTRDASPNPHGQHERTGTEMKRKYRRHPKPDKHAPERSPSAYVLFSNHVRKEVRGQNLSFTDIAKLVGDRWQKLSPEEKEPFESKANEAKEKSNIELAQYKKTNSYKEYTQYIADFKAKHSSIIAEAKRPKLESDSNSGSASGRPTEIAVETRPRVSTAHTRDVSIGSVSSTSHHSGLPSPKGSTAGLPPTMMGYAMSTNMSHISSLSSTESPALRSHHRESWLRATLAVQNPSAIVPHQTRGDLPELHSRTGQLSLAPLTANVISPTVDFAPVTRAAALPPLLLHQSSVSSVAQSDSSGTSNPPPITPVDEPWRYQLLDDKSRGSDWQRVQNPLLASNPSAHFGGLPPLQSVDRVPDISRDPTQRTLPFPTPSSPDDPKASFRGRPRIQTPLASSESSGSSSSEPHDELKSPTDNPEQDAANALAVLAYTRR